MILPSFPLNESKNIRLSFSYMPDGVTMLVTGYLVRSRNMVYFFTVYDSKYFIYTHGRGPKRLSYDADAVLNYENSTHS